MPFPGAVTDTANATLLLSIAAALLYAFALETPPSPRRTAIKTLAVALLAVLVFIRSGPPLLIAALGLSAAGDAFLSRDGDERAFLAGLASFLAAHLAYVALFFLAGGSFGLMIAEPWRAVVALAVALFAVLMLARLWRAVTPDLRVPIAIYIVAILAMAVTALTVESPAVIIGALLFMASDAILAAEKFLMASSSPLRRPARFAVWALYYAAQLSITVGFLLT